MFSKLKGAVSAGVNKAKGGSKEDKKAEKERLAREKKEADEAKDLEKQELLEIKLLPWGFADYVKIMLFLAIKLPFILCVGVLATIVEMQVKSVNTKSWHRPTTTTGPSCFVTELTREILNYNASLNEIATDLGVGPIYNESKLIVGNTSRLYNFSLTESDHCGIIKDQCKIDPKLEEAGDIVEDQGWFWMGHGGIDFGYFFPFALVWMLYKLIWIPLWPVDRLAKHLAGNVTPPPQPVFRLVTQPHFQVCSGFLSALMMVLNMLRYVFLPNYLLLPLTTLTPLDNCEPGKIKVHYTMDWIFGQAAYIWLVADLIVVVIAYAFFSQVYKGKVVGTWAYRLYKVYWVMTSITAITLFICNLVFTFDINIFRGLNFQIVMAIDFNFLFNYSIDVLAFMACANYIMEALSLTYTIGGILLPLLLSKIPCCKGVAAKFQQQAEKPKSEAGHAEEMGPLLAAEGGDHDAGGRGGGRGGRGGRGRGGRGRGR